jgi:hypothetical protein
MAKAAHRLATDAEARKRGDQTGLDTLVVHALNDVCLVLERKFQCRRKPIKHTTWGVRSQG